MSFEAAAIVSAIILIATVVILGAVFASRKKAARDEELKQQSLMRGWSFESTREGRYRVHRWKGNTNGVAWIAESRERPGGHEHRAIRRSRWLTTSTRGPDAPILCMGVPPGKEDPSIQLAQGDSWIAKLAGKAVGFAFDKAVDAYFGEEIGSGIDAARLKRVPGAAVPGYIVMAGDVDAAARVLFQGLTRTLTTEPLAPPKDSGQHPWILLWKDGVGLGKAGLIDSIEELERMAYLGAAVARLPIV